MSGNILIIDFEDSFTYNIAASLYSMGIESSVTGHQDFFKEQFVKWSRIPGKKALILGPGPGHPEIYQHTFSILRQLLQDEQIYIMGICLGHQLLALVEGFTVRRVDHQIHGQTESIVFRGIKAEVQRYNSLGVFEGNFERTIREWPRGISYQFHPESVGTDKPEIFFKEMLGFLQN